MKLRTTLAVVAAFPLLLLTSCGGQAAKVADSPTSSSTGGSSSGALTQANFATTVADASTKAKTAHFSGKFTAQGNTITMTGDVKSGSSLAGVAENITMQTGSAGTFHLIFVHKVLYMNLGTATQNKYVKIDLNDPNNPLGSTFNQVLANLNPAQSVAAMKSAITGFTTVGHDTIGGTPTTHYKVTLDTKKLFTAMKMGKLGSMSGSVPSTVTYDMWITHDNLPRRLTSDIGGTTVQLDMTHWGKPVSIAAPPASQVSAKNPFGGSAHG
ncbi:MAG: LppX_LprAFG lipoprotein [Nocardioidaceae bacterium]